MNVYSVKTGAIQENTYFVVNDDNHALIFDPGNDADILKAIIDEKAFQPIAILLTHAHYDHIGAVDALREAFGIPVYVHYLEKDFLMDSTLNLSSRHLPNSVSIKPADVLWEVMGAKSIGNFHFRIEHVPGHSPGSTAYLFDSEHFAIVGDTLFKGGCGRTDLPSSSTHAELMNGIRQHLMTLPEETAIYSGHGEPTTIQQERLTNPYLNGVSR